MEENLRMQSDQELLHLSAVSMAERLRLMEESVHKSSIASHDRRHFNGMVLELLEQGQPEEAAAILRRQTEAISLKGRRCCENTVVGAAVCYYAALAEGKGIAVEISLDIPEELEVDSLELSMAVSNLLENAIHGCDATPEAEKRYLRFVCCHVGRLVLEISNSCAEDTVLDENGFPDSHREGHGVGTRSVLAFAGKYDAELFYRIEHGTFTVRMLL